jgi:hypothetical protein
LLGSNNASATNSPCRCLAPSLFTWMSTSFIALLSFSCLIDAISFAALPTWASLTATLDLSLWTPVSSPSSPSSWIHLYWRAHTLPTIAWESGSFFTARIRAPKSASQLVWLLVSPLLHASLTSTPCSTSSITFKVLLISPYTIREGERLYLLDTLIVLTLTTKTKENLPQDI